MLQALHALVCIVNTVNALSKNISSYYTHMLMCELSQSCCKQSDQLDLISLPRSYCKKHSKNRKDSDDEEERSDEERRSQRHHRIMELEEEFYTLVKASVSLHNLFLRNSEKGRSG